jgi:rod shape determining protein RodA
MNKKILKNINWSILICVLLLVIIGLVSLYSASQNSNLEEFKKQCIWILISIPIMIITILIDYNFLARFSFIFYGILIVLLIAVLFTSAVNGATSWFNAGFFSFQPGEIGKIITILFLSYMIVKIQNGNRKNINKPLNLAKILLVAVIPIFLIALEPDYGTAIAYIIALLLMLYVAGINKKYILITTILIVIIVPLLYFFVLPEHAKSRIDVYLNPNLDSRGAGYNIIQSKLAIGAGKLFGMGYLQGTQTQLGFLYPKTTDFIFSVIGEEMGFIMCTAIVIIYVMLITKAINVAKTARDDLGAYIAIGIAGIFLFHMTENIGMTIGLLPITGIPLPFISYGGSSLITNFICIGLLLGISARKQKNIFGD